MIKLPTAMTSPVSRLAWGILATGRIAAAFARGVNGSHFGRLVAVGSRSRSSAERFAAEHGIPRAHGSYDALLTDPEVQAVYIATPHPQHVEWAVRAAEAGKHILCEKPVGLNHAEAMVIGEAARRAGVTLMEAWMYRCHPLTQRVADLVREGAIGELRHVQASFSYHAPHNAESRTWANALGGGGILDVGGYPMSYARLLAGAAAGRPFLDPERVAGVGHLHPETGIDVHATAVVRFAGGITGELFTGVGVHQEQIVRVYGTEGWLAVPSPYVVAPEPKPVSILRHRRDGAAAEELVVTPDRRLYAYEADAFAEAVFAGSRDVPACTWADSLGNLAALDAWRREIGLVYEAEKPENLTQTHTRRPLARRAEAPMRYGALPGLEKRVSRLVLGVDNQRTMPHAAAMFDDFFERGGNAFDTAFVYLEGMPERLLGQWVRHRGVRSDVVLIAKGAHTPYCTPEYLTQQLRQTLDRLQTDHVDVYLMHRDNPEVPVGEFVDVLDEHVRGGLIKVFGGSNWTIPRVAAANRYAKRKGRQAFGALSNNLSLARMVDPVWSGCVSAHDRASRRWLKRQQLPLLSWSSQARGFFTGRAAPDRLDDAELVRCWYAEDNFQRLERTRELAERKGVSPIAVAAAWVLQQPFPTFALIGPRTIAETVSSMECLGVELTAHEAAWLNLER
jgi:predicted dehydrogenase/diketogulonate reductase-like aldo/keto reductase